MVRDHVPLEDARRYLIGGGREFTEKDLARLLALPTLDDVVKQLAATRYRFLADIPESVIRTQKISVIEKERYVVPCGDLAWEIDVFSGENAGLIIAEIELRHEDQHIDLPGWIGAEVTGQRAYYNSALVERPFCTWSIGADTASRTGP